MCPDPTTGSRAAEVRSQIRQQRLWTPPFPIRRHGLGTQCPSAGHVDAIPVVSIRPTHNQLAYCLAGLFTHHTTALYTVKSLLSVIKFNIAHWRTVYEPCLATLPLRGRLAAMRGFPSSSALNSVQTLASLTEAPYDPQVWAFLTFRSFTITFSLTLASGRRGSEIHAFSGSSSGIASACRRSATALAWLYPTPGSGFGLADAFSGADAYPMPMFRQDGSLTLPGACT